MSDYPVVIEPLDEALEVTKSPGSGEKNWTRLERVPTHVVFTYIAGIPHGTVHFFGESSSLDRCRFLLCYNAGGLLTHVLSFKDKQWNLLEVPEELTGQAVEKPSVRLVFEDTRGINSFMRHIKQVRDGEVHNPTLSVIIENLAAPIRTVGVWINQEDEDDET